MTKKFDEDAATIKKLLKRGLAENEIEQLLGLKSKRLVTGPRKKIGLLR